MVSASDTDTDFTVGKTGGSKVHSHTYGIVYGDVYGLSLLRSYDANPHTGVIDYELKIGNRIRTHGFAPIKNAAINHADTVSGSYGSKNTTLYQNEGCTTNASSMPQYVSVYIWRRTA